MSFCEFCAFLCSYLKKWEASDLTATQAEIATVARFLV